MLVVLDTNIIISGLYSKRGASYALLKGAISGELPYAIAPLIALEYEGKIEQKTANGFLKISKDDMDKILDALFAYAKIIWRPIQLRPMLKDPGDDKILECAISGGCTHIVTFNKHHFPSTATLPYGIEVMRAGEFLKVWRSKL